MDIEDQDSSKWNGVALGTLTRNEHGVVMKFHGWGWWPADPTKNEAEVARNRDIQFMAKQFYGSVVRQLGATKASYVSGGTDSGTIGRYYLGDAGGLMMSIAEIPEVPGQAQISMDMNLTFLVPSEVLNNVGLLRRQIETRLSQRLANAYDVLRGPAETKPEDECRTAEPKLPS